MKILKYILIFFAGILSTVVSCFYILQELTESGYGSAPDTGMILGFVLFIFAPLSFFIGGKYCIVSFKKEKIHNQEIDLKKYEK